MNQGIVDRNPFVAHREKGGIRIGWRGNGVWMKYVDAWLLMNDLRTALKGIDQPRD